MNEERNTTDLAEFIRDVKRQIKQSEDQRPEDGFWIGVQSIELEVDAVTERKVGGGVKLFVVHGDLEETNKRTQRTKINMVTQDFKSSRCPKCNHSNPISSKYCNQCGQKL